MLPKESYELHVEVKRQLGDAECLEIVGSVLQGGRVLFNLLLESLFETVVQEVDSLSDVTRQLLELLGAVGDWLIGGIETLHGGLILALEQLRDHIAVLIGGVRQLLQAPHELREGFFCVLLHVLAVLLLRELRECASEQLRGGRGGEEEVRHAWRGENSD